MLPVSRAIICVSLVSLWACEDSPTPDTKAVETRPSVGDDEVDASAVPGQEDASSAPMCSDDPSTPGNDCADAVACHGKDRCGLEAESCCVPGLDVMAVACVEGTTCEDAGRATCDGPEDCNGKACCVNITAGTATCATELACAAGYQLCHRDEECANGTTCTRGGIFTWWGLCQ